MKANACQFFIICGMANRICTKIETTVTNILRDHQTFIGKNIRYKLRTDIPVSPTILHGCINHRHTLVGINAVVMDGVVIGENSIVGVSAFVKAKAEMPTNYLIVSSPAKAIRELSEQELALRKQGIRCW